MAFILTHNETGVKNFVTTVEIPFQWQVDLKRNQNKPIYCFKNYIQWS